MPSISVKCPLCPEKCSEKNIGKHLTSKAHADTLRKNNEPLKSYLQVLKDNSFHQYKNHPPLFTISNTESLHICMTCKKCYKNGEGRIGSAKHYEKSPACKKERIQELESFLFPKVKANDANNALAEELKKKSNELIATEKGRLNFQDKYSNEQDKVTELKEIIKMMIDSKFDIDNDNNFKMLKEYLTADSGNQSYYTGRFNYEEEE
jgi:hypothetical protein